MRMTHNTKNCPKDIHNIDIHNFSSGEEVNYSVVVIQGSVQADDTGCQSEKNVIVKRINGPWCTPATTRHCISSNLNFKCILRLERGVNTFILNFCSVQQEFTLHFRPRRSPFCVLPVYLICKGHDGRFQSPGHEDNSIDSACERIDIGLRLVQSIFAERLKEGGYGRHTFQLQSDLDPMVPEVHVFYSVLTVEQAHAMETPDLWAFVGREIMLSHLGKENHKFVAFLSSTYYRGRLFAKGSPSRDDILKCTEGYIAIAGGGLALVGTGCLHTWATAIEEVVPRLSNLTKVDTTLLMDDSNHRGTYGGCYASTLGTICHELSHTFDVGHTAHGIMGSEYHSIQQIFLQEEGTLPRLRPADDIHDLQITLKEVNLSRPAVKQTLADQNLNCADAMLVQQLKVAWSVSDVRPQQHLRVTSVCSPGSHTEPAPLDLTSIESGRQDEANLRYTQLSQDNTQTIIHSVLPDCSGPTFDCDDVSSFWPQSALALIAYSKWINPKATEENFTSISFDKSRRHISSTHGLRVVDLRDVNSKSILHWKFTQSIGQAKFYIPEQYFFPNLDNICIIDSIGHVLKIDKKDLEPNKSPN